MTLTFSCRINWEDWQTDYTLGELYPVIWTNDMI